MFFDYDWFNQINVIDLPTMAIFILCFTKLSKNFFNKKLSNHFRHILKRQNYTQNIVNRFVKCY